MMMPNVLDGATLHSGSDRYAYTVIAVLPYRKMCIVQRDAVQRIDNNGISESQQYAFTRNPTNCDIRLLRLNKHGKWRDVENGAVFTVDGRSEYRDPSF